MAEKTSETAMTQAAPSALVKPDYGIDVNRVVAMRSAVEEVISKVLREGEHFGALPGVQGKDGKKPKKMLFQPGAEVLCQVFRLRPQYEELSVVERDDFISLKLKCKLFNSVTGEQVGEAIGSANSREDKYASQVAAKLCPTCGAPTICKSKDGGWFCWAKKGGCGATFADEDKKLLDQTGTVSIVRLYGLYHTLESIAQKRCFVKATRTATATSDIFTDEDAPPDDDGQGQAGAQHQRTSGAKTTSTPKAGVTQVRDLNEALRASELLPANLESLPKGDRDGAIRKLWLDWANGMLEDESQTKVASMMELTPEQCAVLIQAAKEKKLPMGW